MAEAKHTPSVENASVSQLEEIAEAARLLIVEGLRLTPDGLIVREKSDRSDPHFRLCRALEDAGLIPRHGRAAIAKATGETGQ